MLAVLRKGLGAEELEPAVLARAEASLQAAATRRWVIHVTKPDDRGPRTFLRYLARYVYRVAMDDRRLLRWEGDRITFSTRGGKTKTLTGWEFARRFLQHALPKGFRKVRHYGLLAPGNKARLARARELLDASQPAPDREPAPDPTQDPHDDRPPLPTCRACGERAVEYLPLPLVRGPPRRQAVAA